MEGREEYRGYEAAALRSSLERLDAAARKQALEQALPQWQFKPFEVMGHPAAVETGLTFAFRSQRQ